MIPILKTVDFVDSKFVFDGLPDSEIGRFGRLGWPAEHSAPKGRLFGRHWSDPRFHLRNSENEVSLLALLRQSVNLIFVAKHQTRNYIFRLETSF